MDYTKLPFVLYHSDWLRMGATIHWSTCNQSALRIAQVYKRMGIKFWYFPLTLLDPALANVNPFDDELDIMTRARIARECKLNPWYFFRECLRLPIAGGVNTPFIFSRGNIASIWSFLNDVDYGLVMPRQTGKSYATQAIIAYAIYILGDNINIAHCDKSSENNVNTIRTIKDIRAAMPQWLWQPTGADVENKESISYAQKHNTYSTFAAAIDKIAAGNMCRGLSIAILHFDEHAYMRYNSISTPAAVAAKINASKVARSQGIPCPTIYTTTAGNPDTDTGAYTLGIFEDALRFSEDLFDLKDHEALIQTINENAPKTRLFLEFSYKQLGFDDAWFKKNSEELNGNSDDIARDLLNVWQASSVDNVIPQNIRDQIRKSKQEPTFVDLSRGFMIRWYLDRHIVESEEFKHRSLIAGMDTSENIGRDWTTLVIVDPTNLNVVATAGCNNANTMQVGQFVTNILLDFEGLCWIPERNNTGIAIIDYVIMKLSDKNINPFRRIYNEAVQQRSDPKYAKIDITTYKDMDSSLRRHFGYRTAGSGATSRDRLYKEIMMKMLELNSTRIKDSTLINEFCNLTVRNGRVDHKEGRHDDMAIALLLSAYLILAGKNLPAYGIRSEEILSTLNVTGNTISADLKQNQIEIRKRIADLESMMSSSTTSYLVKQSCLREINALKPLVDNSIMESTPIAASQVDAERREVKSLSGSDLQKTTEFAKRLKDYWTNRRNSTQSMRAAYNDFFGTTRKYS